MDRKSLISSVVLALSIHLEIIPIAATQPNDGLPNVEEASQPTSSSNQQQSEPAPGQQQSQPKRPPVQTTTAVQNQNATEETDTAEKQSPRWYAFLARPEWVLVIVGGITFVVVAWQARETRRAAEAAETGIRMGGDQFRLVNQQWLETQKWEAQYTRRGQGLHDIVDIHCEIFNPTNMAVTLTGINTTILDRMDGEVATSESTMSHVLPPRHDYPTSGPSFVIKDVGKWEEFKQGTLRITVTGTISYVDAFKQTRTQAFGRLCIVGMDKSPEFVPFDGTLTQHHPSQNKA